MSILASISLFLVAAACAAWSIRSRRDPDAVVAPEPLLGAVRTRQPRRDLGAELKELETSVRAKGGELVDDPDAPARAQPTFGLIRATVRERIEVRAAELSSRTARAAASFTSAAARLDHALASREEAAAAVPVVANAAPPRPRLMAITGAIVRPLMLLVLFLAEANLTEPTFRAFTSSDEQAFWLSRLFAFGLVVAAEMTGRMVDYLTREDHNDRDAAPTRYWSSLGVVALLNAMFVAFVLSMSAAREHNEAYTESLKVGAVAAPVQGSAALPTGASVAAARGIAAAPAGAAAPSTPATATPSAAAQTPPAETTPAAGDAAPTASPQATDPPMSTDAAPAGSAMPEPPRDGSFSPLGAIALPRLAAKALHPDLSFVAWAQLLFYVAGVVMVWGHARCGLWLAGRRELRRARWHSFAARRRAAWCDSRLQRATRPLDAVERRTRRIVTGELAKGRRVDAAFSESAEQDLDAPPWPEPDDIVVALLLHANVQLARPSVEVTAAVPGPVPTADDAAGAEAPEGFPHVIADDFGAAGPEVADDEPPLDDAPAPDAGPAAGPTPEPEPTAAPDGAGATEPAAAPDDAPTNGAAEHDPPAAHRDRATYPAADDGADPDEHADEDEGVAHGEPFQGGPEPASEDVPVGAGPRDRSVT